MSMFIMSSGFGLLPPEPSPASPQGRAHGEVLPDAVVEVAGEVNEDDMRDADEPYELSPGLPPGGAPGMQQ